MDKKRILLIDDDASLLDTLGDFLSIEGYEVISADCAEAGLKVLETENPDLIILDMSMPGMGGIGFLNEVSGSEGRTSHPVLVLTARANMAEFFAGMEVDGFIAKPCDPGDLLAEVGRIIFLRSSGQASSGSEGSVHRVLIAEDDGSMNAAMCRTFSHAGFQVDSVHKGPEVLERAVLSQPDVVVVKHVLSGMDGEMVASILKDMPNVAAVPVVLYGTGGNSVSGALSESIKAVVATNQPESILEATKDVLGI